MPIAVRGPLGMADLGLDLCGVIASDRLVRYVALSRVRLPYQAALRI